MVRIKIYLIRREMVIELAFYEYKLFVDQPTGPNIFGFP